MIRYYPALKMHDQGLLTFHQLNQQKNNASWRPNGLNLRIFGGYIQHLFHAFLVSLGLLMIGFTTLCMSMPMQLSQ